MLWEYKTIRHDAEFTGACLPGRDHEKVLNAEAENGWECFAVVHGGHAYPRLTAFYFKRPKPQAAAAESV